MIGFYHIKKDLILWPSASLHIAVVHDWLFYRNLEFDAACERLGRKVLIAGLAGYGLESDRIEARHFICSRNRNPSCVV